MESDLDINTSVKFTLDIPNEFSLEDPTSTYKLKVGNQWNEKENYRFRVHRVRSFGDLISSKNTHAANNAKEFSLFLDGLRDPEEIPDEFNNRKPFDNFKKYCQENKDIGKTCDNEQESKVIQEEEKNVIVPKSNHYY